MYLIKGRYEKINRIAEKVTDFFFPWGTYCASCGNIVDGSRTYCLCDYCMKNIQWGNVRVCHEGQRGDTVRMCCEGDGGVENVLESILACMGYGNLERSLIFGLKYNKHTYLARIMGRIMADRLQADEYGRKLLEADYIIPVPMHREKKRARGFNQTEKTGKYLAGFIGVPMIGDGLVRSEKTAAQRSVSGSERFNNMSGAFEAAPWLSEMVKGKHVILLDDIYTTGATAWHCGKVLKDSGCSRVDCLVLASSNDDAVGFF